MNELEDGNSDEHGYAVQADVSRVNDDVPRPSLEELGGAVDASDDNHERGDHHAGE